MLPNTFKLSGTDCFINRRPGDLGPLFFYNLRPGLDPVFRVFSQSIIYIHMYVYISTLKNHNSGTDIGTCPAMSSMVVRLIGGSNSIKHVHDSPGKIKTLKP